PLLEEQVEEKAEDAVPTVDSQTGTEDWQANGDTPPEVQEASSVGEIDWKDFAENYGNDMHGTSGGNAPSDDDDRRPALENILVKRTLLPDHLMWQLRLSDLSNAEKEVGAILIGSLDKDGYLTVSLEEAAFLANVWPDTAIVERVLMRLQEFDPPGVAARTLSECLLVQLRQLGLAEDSLPARIVRNYLPMLESRRFDRLARELGAPMEQIAEATKIVSVHESTVSRATAGKYVHTPQGTFELKYFFTSSLRSGRGEDVSAESVKDKIRGIIAKEDAKKPLSDQYIAEMLGKEQIDIARRTV